MARKTKDTGDPKPRKRAGKKAAKAQIERAERINEALDYRRQGFTYRQIAAEMKCSASTAHDLVQAGINQIPAENAQAVKAMMLGRLDDLMQRLMPLAEDDPLSYYRAILDVDARLMKLHGIGAPRLPGDDDEGDDQRHIWLLERIKASAPVLRPDPGEPMPANPIL
jgi:hypothetical protein